MIPALIIILLHTGWGVFGYTMCRMGSFHFHDFPAWMIPLCSFIGAIMGLGVLSVTKSFGFS